MIKRTLMTVLLGTLFCAAASAVTLQYTIQELGPELFRIDYTVSGAEFFRNQELEIRFDPAVYTHLTDGLAPALFDVLFVQPNNPPGTVGRFSAVAHADNPDVSAGFGVTVQTFGSLAPVPQQFAINQLDESGLIVSNIATGVTSAAVPEPATLGVTGVGLFVACALGRRRRFRTPT